MEVSANVSGKKSTCECKPSYHNLSLVDLIHKIVNKNDRAAIEEFHKNRTLFSYNNGPPLLCIHYLNELRDSTVRRENHKLNALEIADIAYDLTLDKFTNLCDDTKSSVSVKNKGDSNMKREGPDCRLYFKAFLKCLDKSFEVTPPTSHLDEEARETRIIRGLVTRHFYFSCLEAERRVNRFWSRYNWKVNGRNICVWLPITLRGTSRREWLEKNIDDPNLPQLGGRQEIQAIINRKLVKERFVRIVDADHIITNEEFETWVGSNESFEISLAQAVAEEKSTNIQQQRRSIRNLGKEKLKQLILCIFNDIGYEDYRDGSIANDYDISKATFSRFAGSKWFEKIGGTEVVTIPDLWKNTAKILAGKPAFMETVVTSGVARRLEEILCLVEPK